MVEYIEAMFKILSKYLSIKWIDFHISFFREGCDERNMSGAGALQPKVDVGMHHTIRLITTSPLLSIIAPLLSDYTPSGF